MAAIGFFRKLQITETAKTAKAEDGLSEMIRLMDEEKLKQAIKDARLAWLEEWWAKGKSGTPP